MIGISLSVQRSYSEEEKNPWYFNGYINSGYCGNTFGSSWNGNINSNSRNGGGLSGLYLSTGKMIDTKKNEIDWGYNFDFLFGEDYRFLKPVYGLGSDWTTGHYGNGMPDYGCVIPQIYGEITIQDWSIRAGNFYTFLGYESSRSNNRFFYSHGIAFDALPGTHTGTMLFWNGSEKLSASLGWVAGHNQTFDNTQHGNMILGNFKLHLNKRYSVNYSFLAGTFSDHWIDQTYTHKTGSIHSWNFEFQPDDQWDLITSTQYFHYRFGDDRRENDLVIGQYLFYTVNDYWKWGLRGEWFGFFPNESMPGNDLVSLTAGFHYSPLGNEKLTIRPEIRYDYSRAPLYGKSSDRKDQIALGFDLITIF